MNKKTMKIVAIIIAFLLLLGVLAPILGFFAFATESDSTLKDYEKKESNALKDLYELELQLNEANEKIFKNEELIKEIDNKLIEINAELDEIEVKENEQMDKFKSRIVATCENSSVSYLELIFFAENLSDFMDKLVIAQELAEYDKNIIDSMYEVKSGIQEKKKAQESLKEQQLKAKEELDSAKKNLEEKTAETEEYLLNLQSDKKAYELYLEEKEKEEALAKEQAGIDIYDGEADISKVPSGSLLWPTVSTNITSNFSPERINPVTGVLRPHTGVDIGGSEGEPIYAADDGNVVFADTNGGYGNCVILNHGNGINTLYAHMSTILVNNGSIVKKGEQIGRVGSTGNSTGPHLHFEILIDGITVNPVQFF